MTDSVPLEVRRFFRSALNKIAVSNYDVLKEELLQSQDFLTSLQDPSSTHALALMLHTKSVDERPWVPSYARLCCDIGGVFAQAVVSECHAETVRGGARLEGDTKGRQRALTNMVLWGHLYLKNVLLGSDASFLSTVVCPLLLPGDAATTQPSAMSVEMFCEVVTVIGHKVEAEASHDEQQAAILSHLFQTVSALALCHPSFRVRCKLLNLMELREKGWRLAEASSSTSQNFIGVIMEDTERLSRSLRK